MEGWTSWGIYIIILNNLPTLLSHFRQWGIEVSEPIVFHSQTGKQWNCNIDLKKEIDLGTSSAVEFVTFTKGSDAMWQSDADNQQTTL